MADYDGSGSVYHRADVGHTGPGDGAQLYQYDDSGDSGPAAAGHAGYFHRRFGQK